PRTHDPSHGAGHTRPVNSGKLFVLCSRSRASFHRPRYTKSFHSGIRLLIGQPAAMPSMTAPVRQNGTPQSSQGARYGRVSFSSSCPVTAVHRWVRPVGVSASGSSRGNAMNPVGLPMSLAPHASQVVRIRLERRHDGFLVGQPLGAEPLLRL